MGCNASCTLYLLEWIPPTFTIEDGGTLNGHYEFKATIGITGKTTKHATGSWGFTHAEVTGTSGAQCRASLCANESCKTVYQGQGTVSTPAPGDYYNFWNGSDACTGSTVYIFGVEVDMARLLFIMVCLLFLVNLIWMVVFCVRARKRNKKSVECLNDSEVEMINA
mmetsp:Transcript_47230/g.78358  ORF Transcript_47230/g.78358 Transcript_47230/m.78358 type:complete len:166 (+) Transcript_47230:108-605(+)